MRILIGILISFGVCVLWLLIFSLGISKGLLPETWLRSLTLAACLFGSGAGGWMTAKKSKGYRLLSGTIVGGGLFLMIMAIGCMVYQTAGMEQDRLMLLIGCLCGGALSGLLVGLTAGKPNVKAKKRKKYGRIVKNAQRK